MLKIAVISFQYGVMEGYIPKIPDTVLRGLFLVSSLAGMTEVFPCITKQEPESKEIHMHFEKHQMLPAVPSVEDYVSVVQMKNVLRLILAVQTRNKINKNMREVRESSNKIKKP